jgi:signal transduction histidine kinase
MVGAIVIGIGVDDSIHLLSRYRSLRLSGVSSVEAMRSAVAHVGRAIVTTSVALALGFLTLMASAWQTISSFGFFVALAILGALAATLFVLPALIFAFAGREDSEGGGEEVSPRAASPAGRQLLALLALLPVVGAVGGTAVMAVRPGAAIDLACWVLPNARVMPVPGSGSCPLAPEDSIRKIRSPDGGAVGWSDLAAFQSVAASAQSILEVGVQSRGEERWVEIPVEHRSRVSRLLNASSAVLAAMALLSIPLFLVWHSTSPAAAPLLFFFAAVAMITVVAMSGSSSGWLTVGAVAAMVAIPATIVHLNLTLLRGRSLIRDAPGFVLVPYGLMSILLPAGWFALQRDPLLWPPFIYLIIVLTGSAAASLLVSCGYAIRESPSPIERARARVLLYGALLLPLLPTFFLARSSGSVSEAIGTYLWMAAVTVQLPIGLAISRDNLFDLGDQLRRWIAQAVYFAAGAAVVAVAFEATRRLGSGGGLVLFFVVALGCMVGIEVIRERLIGYLEARVSPRGVELRRVGQSFFAQISELREPAEVATLLGETLEKALRPRASCVFLGSGAAWRPVFVSGEQPPAQISLAEDATTVLTGRRSAQLLEALEAPDLPTRQLGGARVELLLSLERDGVLLGMVLLSPSQGSSPYTGTEVRFASSVAEQTSLALHNARLASDLVSAELQAGTARVALTLVHQLGKELDWIRGLAKYLPSRLSDPAKAERDAKRIRDLSDDVARRARGFLEDASAGARRQPGTRSLDSVLDRSIQLVSERFGSGRVTQTIAPSLDWARVEDSVESVLLNLLDNALRASPPDAPVHVLATQDGDWLQITVSDCGCGMSPEMLARSFEFGFSARADGGGHGLGLAVSKETVEGLGGSLGLESEEGAGTRVTLRLPATATRS